MDVTSLHYLDDQSSSLFRKRGAPIGQLGALEVIQFNQRPDSRGAHGGDIPPSPDLPRAGIIHTQALRSFEQLPVVVIDDQVGRERNSVLVTQKGKFSVTKTRKGSPTFSYKGAKGTQQVVVYKMSTGRFSREWVKTAQFVPSYFADIGSRASTGKSIQPGMLGQVYYFAGDFPSIVSGFDSVINSALPPNMALQQGFKFGSVGSIGTGLMTAVTASRAYNAATRINDVGGLQIAYMRIARVFFEIGSGIMMLGIRSINIMHLAATSVVSQVAFRMLNTAALGAGIGNYLFLVLPMVVNAVKSRAMIGELNSAMDLGRTPAEKARNGLQSLINRLEVTPKEKNRIFGRVLSFNPGELYKKVTAPVTLHEDEAAILTSADRDDIRQFVDHYIQNLDPKLVPLISDWGHLRANLSVRLMKNFAKLKMVKESKYARRAGPESLTFLKKEIAKPPGLRMIDHLNQELYLKRVEEILGIVKSEANAKIYISAALAITCAMGVAAMIASTVVTGGAPLMAVLVIGLVSNVMMVAIDAYAFALEMQGLKDSCTKDRVIIALFGLLSAFSVVVGSVMSGGGLPLVAIILGGLIMVSIHAVAITHSYTVETQAQKERERQELMRKLGISLPGINLEDRVIA